MQICDYGCGLEAIHQFKSSNKWCCSCNVNSCPGKRKTDSEKKKGTNPWAGKDHPRGFKGKTPHNKGKTYQELYGEKAIAIKKAISERSKGRDTWSNLSEEQKDRARQNLKKVRIGGYIRGSGYGKKGWYKGFWCDSSWELAYVIYNLEHNIDFKRNKDKFPYSFNDKMLNWIPDFIMSDGTYIEIKGVITEQVNAKLNSFSEKLILLTEKDMKHIFDYVFSKYGKNFIYLYETGEE